MREQIVNAERARELGLGYCLDSPTPDDLRRVTESVVSDARIRANLAAMRNAIDDAGGATAAADRIELEAVRSRAGGP